MDDKKIASDRRRALIAFCRDLFNSNITGTDLDDVQMVEVKKRDFPQQPGGSGLHVSFSVSWHMIGKTGKEAHDALDVLLPYLKDQE